MSDHIYCRLCGSQELIPIVDLGHHPPSNAFLSASALSQPETSYPLRVVTCDLCGFSQLDYVVPARVLFGPDYPYDSSISNFFRTHFAEMSGNIVDRFELDRESRVVDIGSNTGTLLAGFKQRGVRVLGIEPADGMAEKANERGIETINEFFSEDLAKQVREEFGPADVVTATNVFAHIDDLGSVVSGVRTLLAPGGVFVTESQYFLDLVSHVEFDMIYHEHLSYMTVRPLVDFFKKQGLELFDAERVSSHGGSIRVYAGFPGSHAITRNVAVFCDAEESAGVLSAKTLGSFGNRVAESRDALLDMLYRFRVEGKSVVGLGAPAKGNTLINYCKIAPQLMTYITEKAEDKIGLFTPGMHIPVVAEDILLTETPDYGVIFAWNLKEEIMKNLKAFEQRGGRFVVPIPTVTVV